MPEVTITYESPKTLKILKDLSKYFDFIVSKPKARKKATLLKDTYTVNGVTIRRGDASVNISEMSDIFTGRNIDAKKLREKAWSRNK